MSLEEKTATNYAKELAQIQEEVARAKTELFVAKKQLETYVDDGTKLFKPEELIPTGKTIGQMFKDTAEHFDACFDMIEKGEEKLGDLREAIEAQEDVEQQAGALPGM